MVSISQAAQLTGVAEHTLRAWERRYGAFQPSRTAGGHRVYDAEALRRIRAMKELVAAGVPPREASDEVRREMADTVRQPDATTALIDAVATLDSRSATRIVDEQFGLRSFESVVDDWLMPALVRVGAAWESGAISEAGEHLATNIVMRRLAASFDAVGPNLPPPPAIIGAPPGVLHEIGLLAFAVALRRQGVSALYLGAQVPPKAWSAAVGATIAFNDVSFAYADSKAGPPRWSPTWKPPTPTSRWRWAAGSSTWHRRSASGWATTSRPRRGRSPAW